MFLAAAILLTRYYQYCRGKGWVRLRVRCFLPAGDTETSEHDTLGLEHHSLSTTSSIDIDVLPLQPRNVYSQFQHTSKSNAQALCENRDTSSPDSSLLSENEPISELQMHELKEPHYDQNKPGGDDATTRGELQEEVSMLTSTLQHDTRTHSKTDQLNLTQRSSRTDSNTFRKQVGAEGHDNPRQSQDVGSSSARDAVSLRQQCIPLQPPHPDLRFNKLLVELNQMITSQSDLNVMKDMLRGEFGKGILEKISEPRMLFIKMREQQLITRNNIIWLQALLKELNNEELIKKTIDYGCQNDKDNVLFFRQVSAPVNGYRNVAFHVYLDKEYTNDDLRVMQARVASILCIETKFVILKEVAPSKSLLVTFMIPEMYVRILVKYLEHPNNSLRDRFAAIGIDRITIDDTEFKIEVGQHQGVMKSNEQLVQLYQQLSKRELQLEDTYKICDQLEQTIQDLKKAMAAKTTQIKESKAIHKQLKSKFNMLELELRSEVAQSTRLEGVVKSIKSCTQLLMLTENITPELDISRSDSGYMEELHV